MKKINFHKVIIIIARINFNSYRSIKNGLLNLFSPTEFIKS